MTTYADSSLERIADSLEKIVAMLEVLSKPAFIVTPGDPDTVERLLTPPPLLAIMETK